MDPNSPIMRFNQPQSANRQLMRTYLTRHPFYAILIGYAVALTLGWWLVSETMAGNALPLASTIVAVVAFFLGLRTGLAAQPAPEAADAADPMPEPAEASPRPAAIALGTAHR
jgi:hypothetical protein